jgi:hypothetical protein
MILLKLFFLLISGSLHIEEDPSSSKSSLFARSEMQMKDQSPSPSKLKLTSGNTGGKHMLFKQDTLPARSSSLQSKIPYNSASNHILQLEHLKLTESSNKSLNNAHNLGSFIKPHHHLHLQQQQQLIHQQQLLLQSAGLGHLQKSDKQLNLSSSDLKNFPSKDSVIKKMKKITKAVQELFKATKESDFES